MMSQPTNIQRGMHVALLPIIVYHCWLRGVGRSNYLFMVLFKLFNIF